MIKKVKQPKQFKTHSQNYWSNLLIFGKVPENNYNREEDLEQQIQNDIMNDANFNN